MKGLFSAARHAKSMENRIYPSKVGSTACVSSHAPEFSSLRCFRLCSDVLSD